MVYTQYTDSKRPVSIFSERRNKVTQHELHRRAKTDPNVLAKERTSIQKNNSAKVKSF